VFSLGPESLEQGGGGKKVQNAKALKRGLGESFMGSRGEAGALERGRKGRTDIFSGDRPGRTSKHWNRRSKRKKGKKRKKKNAQMAVCSEAIEVLLRPMESNTKKGSENI